ncbi:transposase, partial [Microcoleus sp. D3_18_C4]
GCDGNVKCLPYLHYSLLISDLLFKSRYKTTSGVVEGINNKLKLIKRSAYGFRNFENFRVRCLLTWQFNC